MEEDIKVLEEYLDKQDRKFVSKYRLALLQAIENLMKGYKELEEKRKTTMKVIGANYIHKDKVREIIEDIDNNKPVIAELKLRKLVEGDK